MGTRGRITVCFYRSFARNFRDSINKKSQQVALARNNRDCFVKQPVVEHCTNEVRIVKHTLGACMGGIHICMLLRRLREYPLSGVKFPEE